MAFGREWWNFTFYIPPYLYPLMVILFLLLNLGSLCGQGWLLSGEEKPHQRNPSRIISKAVLRFDKAFSTFYQILNMQIIHFFSLAGVLY